MVRPLDTAWTFFFLTKCFILVAMVFKEIKGWAAARVFSMNEWSLVKYVFSATVHHMAGSCLLPPFFFLYLYPFLLPASKLSLPQFIPSSIHPFLNSSIPQFIHSSIHPFLPPCLPGSSHVHVWRDQQPLGQCENPTDFPGPPVTPQHLSHLHIRSGSDLDTPSP